MRVLVGCEESGVVRDAFRTLGHDAWSCDLKPNPSPYHVQGNVIKLFTQPWDLLIAHPPCTRLCNSGVRWLAERDLWQEMREAAHFFKRMLNAPMYRIAVENPIPHRYAVEEIGCKYDQIIHPWQHGHGESKATCLWLRHLPPLTPSNVVAGREQKVWKMGPSPERAAERSKTYSGIAAAMAAQWGSLK